MGPLTAKLMRSALSRLDELVTQSRSESNQTGPVTLVMGGGGAMILAHGFPMGTTDIDAVPKGMELAELDPLVKRVAKDLSIAPDWLNPYFSTFAHTLPENYSERLVEVFHGSSLVVNALGKEEMLIMKCFAHRQKDVPHAKALIKGGADLSLVEEQLEALKKKSIPGTQEAMDFLDDVHDQLE